MNKVKFGRIVKSLRLEHVDYASGGKWSQQQLAEKANLTRLVVGKVERGERSKLEGGEIAGLADALQLSTLERQAFFAAATEVHEDALTADLLQSDMAFDDTWSILSTTKLPAFLIDPLFNLVGINYSMMAFHGLTDQRLDDIAEAELGTNVLRLMFRETSILRESMGARWDAIARANLHQFRFTALPYRYLAQFETLLALMHKRPDFSRLWIETRLNPNRDFCSQLRHYDYNHTTYGPVRYAAAMSTIVTNYGNLYLMSHVPCDDDTLAKFTEIGEKRDGARKVTPWPSFAREG